MGASEERALSAAPATDSPIDLTELLKLGDAASDDSSPNFVHDIIELFLQLAPDIYETARAAVADNDGGSLASAAHKLKSQAAYFGAHRMSAVCRQLEELGHSQSMARSQLLIENLEDELDRVVAALQPHRFQNR